MKENVKRLKEELINIVKETIKEQFVEEGVELIDLELKGNEHKRLLRIFIDKKGGITLDDCKHFSRGLSVMLDVKDPIKSKYTLEVSSPGEKWKIF